ncbi:hypothetical protein NQ176_g430 [Zarea fungicola]|uniref:Uncharacterized protein n=1 Tax=Zarea fungicola TaxID=93591 RepID=A0ACC1NZS2_9HYPO|nr:hypothetical protein NQ176_g430 [Lecanicillium fungicola]
MLPLINLQLGWPSPSLFPTAQLLDGASTILHSQKKASEALIYGPDEGYAPLREHIAQWLSSIYITRGDAISSDRVCISNGASANLANILTKFTEPGYTRRIWMVEPCYFLACPVFTDAGFAGRLRGVPEDEEGLDIDFLRAALHELETEEEHPLQPIMKTDTARYPKLYKHVIYAVPTFANPSGKTMSLQRRLDLVRLAREFDALIVTDDVYDALRWPRDKQDDARSLPPAPPRIVDIDCMLSGGTQTSGFGNSVSNGSFSKIIAPGVRTGWAEAAPAFVEALSKVGATVSGGCPSHMSATFIYEMLVSGKLKAHIDETLIPTYRARYHALLRAVETHLVPLGFGMSSGKPYDSNAVTSSLSCVKNGHDRDLEDKNGHATPVSKLVSGGYFTYITIPTSLAVSVDELAALALTKYNLKFAFGAMMTVEGDNSSKQRAAHSYGNGIRLCWAWHTNEELEEGVRRLAGLVMEVNAGQYS